MQRAFILFFFTNFYRKAAKAVIKHAIFQIEGRAFSVDIIIDNGKF